MAGWHHPLNGHECEQTLGNSEGEESLACCSPWAPPHPSPLYVFKDLYHCLTQKVSLKFPLFPQNKMLELTSLKISKSSPCPNL